MLTTTSSAKLTLLQVLAAGGLILSSIQLATADSLNYKADASVSWLYNDNPTLRPSDSPLKRDATSYGRLLARGIVEYETARAYVDLAPRISSTYYPKEEDSDLETVDFYVTSDSNYRWIRSGASMAIDYNNVGLLTSEFGDGVDNGPGGSGAGDIRRVDDRVQRLNVSPNYDYQLSGKDTLSVGLDFRITDYELEKTNRADSETKSLRVGYRRSLNERWQAGLSATGRKFRAEKLAPIPDIELGLINRSESVGLSLDLTYQWHINGNIGISVGRTNTSNERTVLLPSDPAAPQVSVTESDIKNTVYNLSVNHASERNKYSLLLNRSIVPSSLGVENTQLSIAASIQRQIRETITGRLSFNGYDQQAAINSQTLSSNSTYRLMSVNGSLSWRIKRSWVLSGVYTFRQNANTSEGFDSSRGKSNQLGATISYLWD